MARGTCKQIRWAQNFLHSEKLVRTLVAAAQIGPADLVYEIGPGRGRITSILAEQARRVVAVETDPDLARQLSQKFKEVKNVEIVCGDFLAYPLHGCGYTIFGNIPYNRTADIIRKILNTKPGPQKAFLILQREAAEKFTGSPRETQFSILAKPFHEICVLRTLRRTDFEPIPGVDSVFVEMTKRSTPLIQVRDFAAYRQFVRLGFGSWKKSLKLAYRGVFSYRQWKFLSRELQFGLDAIPTELTFEQWLGLFHRFRDRLVRN